MPAENIVHAEFFLGSEPESLSELELELSERAADGSPGKIHLRFLDDSGLMTGLVRQSESLEEAFDRTTVQLFGAWCLWRRWLMWRRRAQQSEHRLLRLFAHDLAVHLAYTALREGKDVAIEESPKLPLRMVRPNERHELAEACARSYAAWAWVFEPDDLCADKLKKVGMVGFVLI